MKPVFSLFAVFPSSDASVPALGTAAVAGAAVWSAWVACVCFFLAFLGDTSAEEDEPAAETTLLELSFYKHTYTSQ